MGVTTQHKELVMGLLSLLFRGNAALEACAVRDEAHILVGAKGEHVAKIQFALFRIDRSTIDRNELVSQTYGNSTAAAVLQYKQRRAIINRSYQSAADNIVGKMTIAALDRELLSVQRPFPMTGDCAQSLLEVSPPQFAQQAAAIRDPKAFGAPKIVSGPDEKPVPLNSLVSIFISQTTASRLDGFPIARQVDFARDALFEHGITLSLAFGNPIADTIPFNDNLLFDDNLIQLRKMSEDIRPGIPQVLRVIVCRMAAHFGETKRNVVIGTQTVRPFCLLNSQERDPNDTTLLHEMIHASLDGPAHDSEPNSVFFDNHSLSPAIPRLEAPRRSVLKNNRAKSVATSFYSSRPRSR
ncbi:MAG: hypothetical protein ABI433_06010 [Burkholderiaceae bacterium]